jgi:hypothetical protein
MATVFCSVADLGGLTELLELLRLVRPVQGHAAISSCCGSGRSFTPRGGSPTVPQLMADRWARGSRGCGDDHDAMERFEDLAGPGPVARQPELAAPATAAQPGGNLQHLEPQQLRLDDGDSAALAILRIGRRYDPVNYGPVAARARAQQRKSLRWPCTPALVKMQRRWRDGPPVARLRLQLPAG